ncbi:MAG TPA: winged helix DNA-binding domain-containing protein [Micromonosporaceae bacterium]
MRRIDQGERRARLVRRHLLCRESQVDHPARAAAGVVALHATDPVSVYLSALARVAAGDVGAVQQALYQERSLVRMLGMRRTMWVVPVDLAGVVHAAATQEIAVRERRRLIQRISPAVTGDVDAWLTDVQESTVQVLLARGEATASELSADEPRLRTSVLMAEGKKYEAWTNITTWVLNQLSMEGRIVRGHPRGSWVSSQYRWAPLDSWLPGGLPDWSEADARVELIRRWLARFGPGTVADIRWWSGFTAAAVKRALTRIDPAEVDLDGAAGLVLADDLEAVAAPEAPDAVLLPALDATPMGWQRRDWFLGGHGPVLFDRSGNVGPTVWWQGRVVGGWAQRKDGEVAYRLLEDIGSDGVTAVEKAAARLAEWVGPVRFAPRFRTPLERELSS